MERPHSVRSACLTQPLGAQVSRLPGQGQRAALVACGHGCRRGRLRSQGGFALQKMSNLRRMARTAVPTQMQLNQMLRVSPCGKVIETPFCSTRLLIAHKTTNGVTEKRPISGTGILPVTHAQVAHRQNDPLPKSPNNMAKEMAGSWLVEKCSTRSVNSPERPR